MSLCLAIVFTGKALLKLCLFKENRFNFPWSITLPWHINLVVTLKYMLDRPSLSLGGAKHTYVTYDAGKLWRAVNSVLHRAPTTSMPTTIDITTLCHSFSTFFVNKIEKIRMKFCDPKHNVPHIPPPEINFPMTSFVPGAGFFNFNWT